MPRETKSYVPRRKPRVGDVVFYHPERLNDRDLTPRAAIINDVRDLERDIVDLTVFLPSGPKVISSVANRNDNVVEGWSFRD